MTAMSDDLLETDSRQLQLLPLPGLSELPPRLQKATAFIHAYAINGEYSHLTRKTFNVLTVLASKHWDTFSTAQQIEILDKRQVLSFCTSIKELRALLGFSPNNHANERIYEAIDRLYTLEFCWNVMQDGDRGRLKSRLVSQWGRFEGGSVTWEYPPDVFELLIRPMPYAKLDLRLANTLSSGPALALYENTCRYITNPSKLTAKLTVDEWICLLCGTGKYAEYKYFKRFVLKPALAELAASEACPLQVTLLETKGLRGRVTHLQFEVTLKTQLPLPTEQGRGSDPRLVDAMRQLGVSEKSINQLLVSHEEWELVQQLEYTRKQAAAGNVRNPAAFFISAVQRGYQTPELIQAQEQVKQVQQREKEQLAQRLAEGFKEHRASRVRQFFQSGTVEQQAAWLRQFELENEALFAEQSFVKAFQTKGLESGRVAGSFYSWLMTKPAVLPAPEDNDYGLWVAEHAPRYQLP